MKSNRCCKYLDKFYKNITEKLYNCTWKNGRAKQAHTSPAAQYRRYGPGSYVQQQALLAV